ncbi:MAG: glycosyltransferase [Saprospiraceae bacterium]|nr:glycosyltransferase [Saprospiraceae bacterium]
MKILFVTSRFPYPLDKGDKLRAFYQIKYLSADHDIHLISIIDEDMKPEWLEALQFYTKSITLIRITPTERILSVCGSFIHGLPIQIGWFYSKKIKNIIHSLYQEINPDHCFCQLLRMAEYAKDLKGPKTLDYMDGFGTSMDRRAKIVGFPLNIFFRMEAKRMKQYEKQIAKSFDNLTIISQQDKSLFDFPDAERMLVLGNGIDEYFTDFHCENVEKKFDLVFVGNMSYLPNVESVKYTVNEIMPLLPEHFKFLISGTDPSSIVKSLASERIKVTGRVNDIRLSYLKGKVFIVSMWSGTGQQNKILEALALGIPCVTTKAVNNAIGAQPDKEILLAETREEFVQQILQLTSNPALYQRIAALGKQFVRENYSWKQKGRILNSIFAAN